MASQKIFWHSYFLNHMQKLRILLTGSNGLLGQKIVDNYKTDTVLELIATARGANRNEDATGYTYAELDITNLEDVFAVFATHKPNFVIHTAAMTDVDACERDPQQCDILNINATQNVADACQKLGIHLIHLSTDFIFDGEDGPYSEEDTPNPLSHYGVSKLKAEEIVRKLTTPWAIVRTVLVLGITKNMSRSNIIIWAKNALSRGEKINVVDDQFRTPTLAEDLADGCILIAKQGATGVYNISGKDFMSVKELVEHIATHWHLDASLIQTVSSKTLNQAAKRPPITGFILEKAITQLGYAPHSFKEMLAKIDAQLKAEGLQ